MAEIMCSNDINWAFRYLSNSKRADGDPDPILHFRPVHWAVVAGNVPALRLLLLHGAKPLGPSATRLTTLHLAALTGNTAVMERLQRLLYQTYYSQDHYVSDEYLKPAAELHEYPLHFAAAYATNPDFWTAPNYTLLRGFLGENSLGETPLHRAAAMGNLLAIDKLIYHEMPRHPHLNIANQVDNLGRTPL